MSEPTLSITLVDPEPGYQPGDTLTAEYQVRGLSDLEPTAVEASVLWYTEGKGDEDLAVHHFERFAADVGGGVDLRATQRFSTTLPNSPLSYDGAIVKIRWCVRVRLFLPRGRELVAEETFHLGDLPRP